MKSAASVASIEPKGLAQGVNVDSPLGDDHSDDWDLEVF